MTVIAASIPGARCWLSGIIPETILTDGSQSSSPLMRTVYRASELHFTSMKLILSLTWPYCPVSSPRVTSWRNKLACNAASCQISMWLSIWNDNWVTGFSDLRGCKKKICRRDVSLVEEAAAQHTLSPRRLVLARTTVLTEKNAAKKLTLGGMAELRAQYLHFFEVSFKF